jgi:hypothetical protein
MSGVWRKLLILVSVVSGVLCIITALFWMRSFGHEDVLIYRGAPTSDSPRQQSQLSCVSAHGRMTLGFQTDWLWRDSGLRWHTSALSNNPVEQFGLQSFSDQYGDVIRYATLPHWLFVLVFAVLPLIQITRLIRRRRQPRAGLCRVCGYDLRATPDRCPECGAKPSVPLCRRERLG